MTSAVAFASSAKVSTFHAWTALIARTSKEQDAANYLKLANLHAYWPCYCKQVADPQRYGFRRARFSAIIPGYIFLAMRPGQTDPWPIVHQTPGILGYLRNANGFPATLSNADIEIIRRIENDKNLPPNPKTAHKFKTGDHVRFVDDILCRWPPGMVLRLADDGRVSIGVNLLGRVVPILAYPHQIEAI